MDKKPKMLPNDLEAEQSLLGCLFISLDACVDAFATIKPNDFYSLAHQKIYDAMLTNYKKNIAVDYVTVSKVLEVNGELEDVGGLSYITDLTNYVPSAANYKHYIDIVRNDSILRQVIDASQKVITTAFDGGDAGVVLQEAEKSIFEISQTRDRSTLEHIKKGVTEAIDLMEKISVDPNANAGVRVGFPTLDRVTNGFKPGEMIIIAARPGIGKTTLAVNFAVNSALKYNKSVAMFDLEMDSLQIAQRFICSTGRIAMDSVKAGTKDNSVWASIFETKKLLEDSNIYIDDTTTITPSEILSKCRRLKTQRGLDLVLVDYLQLMKGERATKDDNRQQEVADMTRSLKLAARELGVPIIVLSQLNRAGDKRTDKTPLLSDLRESGAIEQDADMVMFIADKKAENVDIPEDGAVDYSLVIAKHRNGARCTIPLKWRAEYTQFYEPGRDNLYTKNTTKVQKDTTMTDVTDSDIDDVFKE